ncbi:MAG: ferric reductase-like transmembrane domain-containing protein [Candidatus Paceibacterota bacterium]
MEPLGARFINLNATMTSLGQIFGLIGMVMFSINLILAGRFKFLDKYFHGLDKVYANHSRLGAIAFSLLLFHPLFLVVKYITFSLKQAALFFVPFINTPITWGIISLLIMIILISFTFYIKLKYNIWKMSHKFMVLAFFFAVLHTIFISSDVSRNNFLRYYILSIAFLGLIISIRQTIFNKFFIKTFKYKVKNISKLNSDILEIEMEKQNQKMDFNPGQFAFFSFIGDGVSSESHPFSISSSNIEDNLKITVKNLGDYTSHLNNLKKDDNVFINGPYGDFSYKKINNKNQIWIAGGIGITPFFSMAKGLENEYKVDLYYSVKEEKEAVYKKEFEEITQKNINFNFNLWNVAEKGYINGELILNSSKNLDGEDIFLCGPPMFMESLKSQFLSLGVDAKKIHYENFNF